jgi:GNAT superfamily N-acetyltransferase
VRLTGPSDEGRGAAFIRVETGMLLGWDEQALLDEVILTPCRAYLPLPDLRVIERPGWMQIITPSFKQGSMNGVSLAILKASEADAVIDATIAEYRRLGVRFRWSVTPLCTPADLGARLERRGLSPTWVVGMAGLTDAAPTVVDPAIRVELVDVARVEEFTDVVARGWQCDPEPFARLNRLAVDHPEYGQRQFIATYAGEPAAAALYMAFARSAYLLGGVVLPEFRGKGLYRALVGARLRDAAERGLSLATSHALEATSAPLLSRMGFVAVCRYRSYES